MGKSRSRKHIVIKCVVIACVVIALVLSFMLPMRFSPLSRAIISIIHHQAKQNQVRLLCETNHKELLDACRELMKDTELMKPGMRYPIREVQQRPEISRLPQSILALKPSVVCIGDNVEYVRLEMAGGTNHFGVRAYPENFKKPFSDFEYGDKELIPGLWYYDDGYRHNPEYGKWIDTLIEEHKGK